MKKKLMALILCMVMALGLTACRMPSDGKRDADNSDVTQSQTQSYEAKDITVAALKGPTAIGMVKLMEDSKEKKTANNYDFKIAASADEFSSLLIKGDVQIAALPCNTLQQKQWQNQGAWHKYTRCALYRRKRKHGAECS